jgi:hypothetical protein
VPSNNRPLALVALAWAVASSCAPQTSSSSRSGGSGQGPAAGTVASPASQTGGTSSAAGGRSASAGIGSAGVGLAAAGAAATSPAPRAGNGGTLGSAGSVATAAGTTAPPVGGSPAVVSSCAAATPTACTAPQVRITEIDVGSAVVVNEDDAALKLLSISPIPSGGSRVAWMGNDSKVHVTTLDCSDNVVSSFALPAMDYGDIYADDQGGVLLVARDAQGGGTLNCGAPSNLCGTPPSPAIACYDMYMVRFDGTNETWATKLTTSSAALPPYSTGPTGPQTYFIWWYAHHGRLAFDGKNWAGYYGAATSVSQACTSGGNTAINIHQGDEMRVVSPAGMILTGHNGFDWGCSHSGFEKIVWDPLASKFASICRSDGFPQVGLNVNAAKLVYAISATTSALSNIVLSGTANSYWTLASDSGTLHLFRFTPAGGTAADVNLGSGNKPHLVKYGNHLFGSWIASGTNMVGQVLDASSGAAIGATVPIAVPSNQFQDFRDYADGSAAYVAPGSSATKLKIVRVLPCKD